MALGVLNNLSAIYAENNLNNTNNSLQTVLQQLSSGSKINSGADDAAGLSLVNGLAANSAALTQSETNATEGVGLLDVADGALSQVTSLLDRAITLATEASNGTLNSTQEGAADQEYQSILSEVNNIGSTTTYNQEQVFAGNTIAIYTGDSSTTGSSIDDLYIRPLSSANVGDSDGQISYSSGANNVFMDLSDGGDNAAATDSLNASGATTITVNYVTNGASGQVTNASANISVGTGTTYSNTAQGLIDAINNAGLGLSATFSTAAKAGSAAVSAAEAANANGGGGSDTGIEISGIGVGTGTNGAGEVGRLTVNNDTDTLGGAVTIVGADGKSQSITLGAPNSTDTLANLAATINSGNYGVKATYNALNDDVVFTASNAAVTISGTNITDTPTNTAPTLAAVVNNAPAVASIGSTLSVVKSTDILGGTLTVTDGAGNNHLVVLGTAGSTDTLANLRTTINGLGYGITATVNGPGTAMTFAGAGPNNVVGANLTDTTPGIDGTLSVAQSGDILGGNLSVTDTAGAIHTFALGTPGSTDTLADLKVYLNTTNVAWGVMANYVANGTSMTFTETNSKNNVVGSNLTDTSAAVNIAMTGAPTSNAVSYHGQVGTLTIGGTGTATDTLGGTLAIGSNTITLGTAMGTNKTDTLANLAATINAGNYGVTATYSAANKDIVFTSANTAINFSGLPTDALAGSTIAATTNAPYPTQVGTLTLSGATAAAGDTLGGTLNIGPAVINLGTPNTTDTLAHLAATINAGNFGVTASLDPTGKIMTFTTTSGQLVNIGGAPTDATHITATLTPTTDTPSMDYSSYFKTGITGAVVDTATTGGTTNVGLVADNDGTGSTATISYSDGVGVNLSSTDLTNQSDAEIALSAINEAISAAAALDGYVGGQINTLTAISQVMSTQQENVVSAQNAVQATDYASATSNMSKYEILSQTGIAALAQANSVQQEVTKLLQ
jgi:flagellin